MRIEVHQTLPSMNGAKKTNNRGKTLFTTVTTAQAEKCMHEHN
jgi:hypothetical protein